MDGTGFVSEAIIKPLERIRCGLVTGHAYMTMYEADRLFLECGHCGHQTTGIIIERRVQPNGQPERRQSKRIVQ